LRKITKQFNPDMAIAVLRPWAGWMLKAAGSRSIIIINTEHNTFERPEQVPLDSEDYKQKFILNKRYTYVTVLTEADRSCLKGVLDNVVVMPNPLAFIPVRVVPQKSNTVLAVGRLDAWYVKGFDVLLRAWGSICKKYPEWELQIAGKGSEKSVCYLKKIASEVGAEKHVSFLGYCNDMLPLYQQSSIFVLSSRFEGFGMVLIEAMSQGCASIACDYKGRQREIITSDEEGVICPVDNVDSLSVAISRVIEDDCLRTKLQWNAVKRSSFFRLDNTMDRWEDILKNVVKDV
jgi:glycosyltransferase involved in cell wall biosynthesis